MESSQEFPLFHKIKPTLKVFQNPNNIIIS